MQDSNCLKANSNMEKRCSTDSCYSRFVQYENEFGSRVERGCLADLTGGCTAANGCGSCRGEKMLHNF